ncbi:predicted protein [Histoplasma mississippiense (nom. inval.)]|uniref:predicted protein n=1 Tax=Ajellomyces capsulatus (strain NAm1 / WU24) TaxID=2059318 RepID=UPI000157D303|nr:predicted protein [Histoplasma mississippiense (nom. inval.)]EDN04467.1 predicted protein [Histoplasma mississippiense (nom. inval.)]
MISLRQAIYGVCGQPPAAATSRGWSSEAAVPTGYKYAWFPPQALPSLPPPYYLDSSYTTARHQPPRGPCVLEDDRANIKSPTDSGAPPSFNHGGGMHQKGGASPNHVCQSKGAPGFASVPTTGFITLSSSVQIRRWMNISLDVEQHPQKKDMWTEYQGGVVHYRP